MQRPIFAALFSVLLFSLSGQRGLANSLGNYELVASYSVSFLNGYAQCANPNSTLATGGGPYIAFGIVKATSTGSIEIGYYTGTFAGKSYSSEIYALGVAGSSQTFYPIAQVRLNTTHSMWNSVVTNNPALTNVYIDGTEYVANVSTGSSGAGTLMDTWLYNAGLQNYNATRFNNFTNGSTCTSMQTLAHSTYAAWPASSGGNPHVFALLPQNDPYTYSYAVPGSNPTFTVGYSSAPSVATRGVGLADTAKNTASTASSEPSSLAPQPGPTSLPLGWKHTQAPAINYPANSTLTMVASARAYLPALRAAFGKATGAYPISEVIGSYGDFVNSAANLGAGSRMDTSPGRVVIIETGAISHSLALLHGTAKSGHIIRVLDAQTHDILSVRIEN